MRYQFDFDKTMGYTIGCMVVSQLSVEGVSASHAIDHPMQGNSRLIVDAESRDVAKSKITHAIDVRRLIEQHSAEITGIRTNPGGVFRMNCDD